MKSRFKILFLFCLALLLISITVSFAGITGKIAGIITDSETGEALAGANVLIEGELLGASSNIDGQYVILNIPPGIYSVTVEYVGYASQIKSGVRIEADRTEIVDFNLAPGELTTEEIVVIGHKSKMIQPDLTSTKQVYLTEDIKDIAGINNVSNIIGLQADVVDGHFRGGRTNETNYYVNGVSIVNPISNSASFNPMVSALQQVDVITSGFSAEYGNAQSGVVNMIMKEGGNEWTTSFIVERDLPHDKYWGASVYSSEVRQYHDLLKEHETWYAKPSDFGIDQTERLYQAGGGSDFLPSQFAFTGRGLKVPKALAFLAQQEYLLAQAEVDREHVSGIDGRYELTIGGPITNDLHVFIAGQFKNTQNKVPYYVPNNEFQIMGNLSYKKGNNHFNLQYLHSNGYSFRNYNPSSPYYAYDVKNYEDYMRQASLKWQYINSSSSLFNVSVGYMKSGRTDRSPLTAKGEGQGDYYGSLYKIVSGQRFGYVDGQYGGKGAETYNFMGDYTSQINFFNLIKAGFQFNSHHVFSDLTTSADGSGYFGTISPKDQVFDHYPYDGAIYIQDKIEYEGVILNAGFRWDFYNFNSSPFSDVVSPIRNPNFISLQETPDESYYDESKAARKDTEFISKLAPRFGISFPIGEKIVFHANYGVYLQRPDLVNVYQQNRIKTGELVDYSYIGNANLKPEETSSYDIGVVLGLPLNFTVDVSAYYKQVKNLLASGRYVDEQQKDYDTNINRDYANIEGFHINMERMSEHVDLIVRYNWQQATGKSEGSGDDRTVFVEHEKYGPLSTSAAITPEDEFMDYDRTNRVVGILNLKTGSKGAPVFNDIVFSATYRYMTGQPYTYDPSGLNLVKNKRTRVDHDLSMRLSKTFTISTIKFLIYLDVYNILDFKQLSFWYVNSNSTTTEKYFSHSPYYSRSDQNRGDFWWDNSLYAYSNQPRFVRLGLTLNL